MEKSFSIFEPHTELLIRDKVAKPIEFGHMTLLQQVEAKFITGYDVLKHRPSDDFRVDDIHGSAAYAWYVRGPNGYALLAPLNLPIPYGAPNGSRYLPLCGRAAV